MQVVLVGGFACPPALLRPLAKDLRRLGHTVAVAPLGLNMACGEASTAVVSTLVEDLSRSSACLALVGHSRGGQLARVVAVRQPEIVDRLVTVATPWTIGPPDRPGVRAATRAIRAARRRGIDVMASIDCTAGPCCDRFRVDLDRKPRARWIALWSARDRIAGAGGRPPVSADVTVDTGLSHVGAITSSGGIAHVVRALTM